MFHLAAMQLHHLDGVQFVQHHAYHANFWETNQALAQKQRLSASSCFVVQQLKGDIVAYLFSHPWPRHDIPKLNSILPQLPTNSDVLYIHDLAVHPAWHGHGLAQQLMAAAHTAASRLALSSMALVAVQGAQSFWHRQGFVSVINAPETLAHQLASYGQEACYMVRT